MGWMVVTARRSGRFTPVDPNETDEKRLINGFACEAEIRAFSICCPGCGSCFDIRASDRHPGVFERRKQQFRCSRCRFAAAVHVAVECGFEPDEPEPEPERGAAM